MPRKSKRHEVIDLLMALRKEGIACTTVALGGVTLDGVIDLRLRTGAKPVDKPEPRTSMWDRYGEELLKQPPTPVDDVPDEAKVD